jgi:ABC-2 type transport system ATP-binding protein
MDISDFADIKVFVEILLQTYSSGVIAKRGFAVASAWQLEIFVLDKMLSVSDITFM